MKKQTSRKAGKLGRVNPLRFDPARLKTLKRSFEREVTRRFRALKEKIESLLVDDDVFGMLKEHAIKNDVRLLSSTQFSVSRVPNMFAGYTSTQNTRWRFMTKKKQVNAFVEWLESEVNSTLIGISIAEGTGWWYKYLSDAYRRGLGRSYDDAQRVKKRATPKATFDDYATGYANADPFGVSDFYQYSKKEFLRSSFGSPVTRERLDLIAGRAFNDLQGITKAMSTQISRELTTGFISGLGPREIARKISDRVDKIGRTRALMLARTEVVAAHADGQLTALENLGMDTVGVDVEWSTSGLGLTGLGNPSPCELCAPMQGVVFKISEARGLIPRHPNCMCSFIPALAEYPEKGQKRSKRAVGGAIDRSVEAEIPSSSDRSVDEQANLTSWVGPDKDISQSRTKAIY